MQLPSEVSISSKFKNYSVSFCETFADGISKNLKEQDLVIADEKLKLLYDFSIINNKIIWIEAKEETKSFENLSPIIDEILRVGARKNTRIVAIGGGITQDTVSFISSILFRGLEWIFFPTTLLAQGDSCIGGKTSINFGNYKNQLGNFNPPNKVVVCVEFLSTITEEEYRSGIGEMCHFHMVSGEDDLDYFTSKYKNCLKKNWQDLTGIIQRTLLVKKCFIEKDEFDKNERLLLNYGHSFGHALESLTEYAIPHGLAVAHGMNISNYLSNYYGYLKSEEYQKMREVINPILVGSDLPKNISVEKFCEALKKDKKNINKNPTVVLTRGVGKMFLKEIEVTDQLLKILDKYFLETN